VVQDSNAPVPVREVSRRARYPWLVALGVVVGAALAVAVWRPWQSAAAVSFQAELSVFVRPSDRNAEMAPIEQPGTLPVESDGAMSLQVRLNQPGYVYLVWIDPEGKVHPLYPWNNESLEVTDIHATPPTRRPSTLVFSPLLSRTFTFGSAGGTETILLMARRTPLSESVNIGSLLESVPPPVAADRPAELAVITVDPQTKTVKTVFGATDPDLTAKDRLRLLLLRLAEHFEVVQAVQFAHEQAE
jgi:hypothetical protein